MLSKNKLDHLNNATDLAEAIRVSRAEFIGLLTPQEEDSSADLKYVLIVADHIEKAMVNSLVVITKSNVPVGTVEKLRRTVALDLRNVDFSFDVASNLMFLKGGAPLDDFMKSD